jgi:hypothetical protein
LDSSILDLESLPRVARKRSATFRVKQAGEASYWMVQCFYYLINTVATALGLCHP